MPVYHGVLKEAMERMEVMARPAAERSARGCERACDHDMMLVRKIDTHMHDII